MKLLMATSNKYKLNSLRRIVQGLDIEVVSLKDLGLVLDVEENGELPSENAVIKAESLINKTNLPIMAWDTGLYIDNFPKDEQPGLFVRRVNGKDSAELTNEEMVEYYSNKLKKYGNESFANYKTGVAFIYNGKTYSIDIDEDKFIMTSNVKRKGRVQYDVFDQMKKNISTGVYFCDMKPEEISISEEKFDKAVRDFIIEVIR